MPKIKVNISQDYFNEKYLPYLNRKERYQVYYGGAGSGKSFFLATSLVLKLFQKQQTLLVVRQTFSSIRDSVFAEIIGALSRMQLLPYVKISKATLGIQFPNGSRIIFKGADDENKLLSISGIDLVWVEEASEITKDLFNQLELRLRGGSDKKLFYLSFNPISAMHWLKEEFFDNPKDDSLVCHSTYLDNRFLDEEYIKNLLDMKERNPQKYEVYALGKWGTTGKKVYDNWTADYFDYHTLIQENHKLKAIFGMDFGYVSDATTLICSLLDLENRKLYIFDEMYEHGLLNNQIAEQVKAKGYAKEVITADSAEQKSIAELKGYGLPRIKPARKGPDSIMNGIQFLQQFEIIVLPTCIHTIDELENYAFRKDKATGKYINKPEDNNNHILDALRYSLEGYSKRSGVSFLNKMALGL
jgi:phage terminase large subunit